MNPGVSPPLTTHQTNLAETFESMSKHWETSPLPSSLMVTRLQMYWKPTTWPTRGPGALFPVRCPWFIRQKQIIALEGMEQREEGFQRRRDANFLLSTGELVRPVSIQDTAAVFKNLNFFGVGCDSSLPWASVRRLMTHQAISWLQRSVVHTPQGVRISWQVWCYAASTPFPSLLLLLPVASVA